MKINLKRMCRHLFSTQGQAKRAFPKTTLAAIEQDIRTSETAHVGEIRFAVEASLSGAPLYEDQAPRERAIDVFAQLRMWDTEYRNGVLIYLLLADHAVEIIADRGICDKVQPGEWEQICQAMESAFREGRYESGILDGIRKVSAIMRLHFPASDDGRNELPDKVVVM